MLQKSIKEIGLILSYVFMLVACYIFDWKPFGIFISFLLETVALFVVFVVLRMIDERKNPKHYKKAQPVSNYFTGIIPLILFQTFITAWITISIDDNQNAFKENLIFTKEVYFAAGSILLLYTIKALQTSRDKVRLKIFQENFLFSALTLTATNIFALILVSVFQLTNLLLILSLVVSLRIGFEIYFSKRMKLI